MNKQLTLDLWPHTYQILANDDQMLILCLSYFITTVTNDKDEVESVKDTKEYVNWKRCEFYGRNFVIKSKSEKSSNDVIQYKKCQSDIGNLNEKDVFFKFGILQ